MATKLVNSLFAQTSTETFEEPAIPITKGVSSEAASVSKNLISAAVADALFSGASQTETSAAAQTFKADDAKAEPLHKSQTDIKKETVT